ncbi:Cytochrome c oxidase polypeptide I / Cytochrome c oxidase polypeptide III [Gulosibacter sp. 10]|nr:Cytochrome c oxidase polypeptide I / Cytochrome c oxidase polypeptide III [Gulosibacter sp. 10]
MSAGVRRRLRSQYPRGLEDPAELVTRSAAEPHVRPDRSAFDRTVSDANGPRLGARPRSGTARSHVPNGAGEQDASPQSASRLVCVARKRDRRMLPPVDRVESLPAAQARTLLPVHVAGRDEPHGSRPASTPRRPAAPRATTARRVSTTRRSSTTCKAPAARRVRAARKVPIARRARAAFRAPAARKVPAAARRAPTARRIPPVRRVGRVGDPNLPALVHAMVAVRAEQDPVVEVGSAVVGVPPAHVMRLGHARRESAHRATAVALHQGESLRAGELPALSSEVEHLAISAEHHRDEPGRCRESPRRSGIDHRASVDLRESADAARAVAQARCSLRFAAATATGSRDGEQAEIPSAVGRLPSTVRESADALGTVNALGSIVGFSVPGTCRLPETRGISHVFRGASARTRRGSCLPRPGAQRPHLDRSPGFLRAAAGRDHAKHRSVSRVEAVGGRGLRHRDRLVDVDEVVEPHAHHHGGRGSGQPRMVAPEHVLAELHHRIGLHLDHRAGVHRHLVRRFQRCRRGEMHARTVPGAARAAASRLIGSRSGRLLWGPPDHGAVRAAAFTGGRHGWVAEDVSTPRGPELPGRIGLQPVRDIGAGLRIESPTQMHHPRRHVGADRQGSLAALRLQRRRDAVGVEMRLDARAHLAEVPQPHPVACGLDQLAFADIELLRLHSGRESGAQRYDLVRVRHPDFAAAHRLGDVLRLRRHAIAGQAALSDDRAPDPHQRGGVPSLHPEELRYQIRPVPTAVTPGEPFGAPNRIGPAVDLSRRDGGRDIDPAPQLCEDPHQVQHIRTRRHLEVVLQDVSSRARREGVPGGQEIVERAHERGTVARALVVGATIELHRFHAQTSSTAIQPIIFR